MLSEIKNRWIESLPPSLQQYAEGLELVEKDIGGEAQQHGKTIWVGSKFFDLDEDVRNWVLTHELGHWYREHFVSLEAIMPWNNPVFGNLDITNGQAEEDFAECFVSYLLAPGEFHSKHPEAFDLMKQVLEEGYLKKAIRLLAKSISDIDFDDIPEDYYGMSGDSALEEYLTLYAMEQGYDPYNYPEDEINEDNPGFKIWLKDAIESQYYDADYELRNVVTDARTVYIYRAMTVPENWIEHLEQQGKHLGIYWSYDPHAAEAHWARAERPHEVLIYAVVPETYVDWVMTYMLNMDPALGEENEIRLHEGVPIELLEIEINGEIQDISALEGKQFYA